MTIEWTTENGTATAGEDYADDDGTLTFSPGDTDGDIIVSITDDEEEESSETFTVVLSNASGDATIDDGTADVSITDNDDGKGPERPGAPQNLAGEPGDHRVTLTWSAPESDGGSKITRYDYRFVAGSGRFPPVWTRVSGGGGTRKFTVRGLSNGIRYRLQVRAVNKAGAGPPATTEARPVDPDATPSLNIEGVSIDEDGGRAELTVSLSPASSEEVSVRYATSNGTATAGEDYGSASGTLTFAAGDTLGTISVSITDDGDDESDETFSVELSNATGGAEIGSGTAVVTILDNDGTEEATPPTEPTGFSANSGDGKVTLSWLAPASDGGSEVTGYQDRHAEGSAAYPDGWNDVPGGAGASRFTVGQLTNGTTYRFQVRAVNEAGGGDPAEATAEPREPARPPGPPTGLSAEPGDREMALTWSVPATDGGEAITRYQYRFTANGNPFPRTWETVPGGGQAKQLTVTRLTNGIRYRFQVRAVNEVGGGASAETTETPRSPATPPGPPVQLSGEPGEGAVTLTWSAPDTDGGAAITGYEYRFTAVGNLYPATWTAVPGGGMAKRVAVVSLTGGTSYRFQVRAVNEAGAGEPEETKVTPLPTMRGDSGRGQEGRGREVRFSVRLSAASNETVRVEFATADGTAIAGEDYRVRSGRLTFAPGSTLETIAVPLLDDGKHEQNETFRLELFNPANASFGAGLQRLVLTGMIADDDELLSVAFAAGSYSVDEGGSVSVSVELSGGANEAIRIPITTAPGPGADDSDFRVVGGVSFDQGQTRGLVTFTATADDIDENDEVVRLRLGPLLPDGIVGGDPVVTEVTIADDDESGVKVSAEVLDVQEGQSERYSVQLTSRPTGKVTVTVEGIRTGSDVSVSPEELVFTPQSWRTRKTVTVRAAQDADAIDEPKVILKHRVAGGDYAGVSAGSVTVTVLKDDTPELSVADDEALEGEGEIVFEASLDIRSSREVTVDYASVAGTATEGLDYLRREGTLVFAPLQTTARIVVPVVDDDIDEPAETFNLELTSFVNAEPGGGSGPATGTILDDDLPKVGISAMEGTVAEGSDVRFRFVREGDLSVRLTVNVGVEETEDFLRGSAPGTVDFAVGSDEAILALPTVDDDLDERDGTITATVQESDEYEISGSPAARVAVTDNDAAPAVIIAGAKAAERAGSITFPITLRGASAYAVTVDWLTGDLTARAGHDYEAGTGRVTFAPGETTGSIRVVVLDDLLPEGPEKFTATLSGAGNAVIEVALATGTITDDDEAVTQAWLSRFGRTVASHVVEGIGGRLAGSGGGPGVLNLGAVSAMAADGRPVGPGDLLDRSSFHISRKTGEPQVSPAPGGVVTAWGRAMRSNFDGAEADVSVGGDVLTGLVALDYETGPLLAGVAVAHSRGDGTLTQAASRGARELTAEVESTLNSVYPYLRVNLAERAFAWGLVGHGRGRMSFPDAGAESEMQIRMNMGAFGARGALLTPGETGFGAALKSDAFLVRMNTVADEGTTSVTADVHRVRLLLEGSNRARVGTNSTFASTVEVGVRGDGGDAETGIGAEVGGGLKYAHAGYGLSIEGTLRLLVNHQDTAFGEWGVGGTVVFQPTGPQRGLSLRMGTSWGAVAGSPEDLWSPYEFGNHARGRPGSALREGAGRFTAQLHYVMPPFGDALSMAPYAEMGLGGGAQARTSRVGWRFNILESFRVSLETNVGTSASTAQRRAFALRGSLRR